MTVEKINTVEKVKRYVNVVKSITDDADNRLHKHKQY